MKRINVTFKELDWGVIAETLDGLKIAVQIPPHKFFCVEVPDDEADKVFSLLEAHSAVDNVYYAVPIELAALTQSTPNDPLIENQWALHRMNVFKALQLQQGDPTLRVAVVDTGLEVSHDEYSGRNIQGAGTNWSDPPLNNPYGNAYHGTCVAGCIAPKNNNSIGIAGPAPNVDLYIIRINAWDDASLGEALSYLLGSGALIANNSWNFPTFNTGSAIVEALIADYVADGGLFIRVLGNGNSRLTRETSYPRNPDQLIVGAIDQKDYRANFSDYGIGQVVGPGVDILTTNLNNGYRYIGGTSFATPYTSAVCALVWSENRSLSAEQVKQIVIGSTDIVQSLAFDTLFTEATGCINALKAVLSARSTRSDHGKKLLPYVQFHGPTNSIVNSTEVKTFTDYTIVELGAYGQRWTQSGVIKLFAGDTLLYEGPPTKPRKVTVGKFQQWSGFETEEFGAGTYTTNRQFTLTGMKWLVCSLFESVSGTGGTVEILIGATKLWGNYLEYPRNSSTPEVLSLDVSEFSGTQTVTFRFTLVADTEGAGMSISDAYVTPDELWESDLILTSQPVGALKVVAIDGGIISTLDYDTMEFTHELDPDYGFSAWQEYTGPISLTDDVDIQWYGVDKSGNAEAPNMEAFIRSTKNPIFRGDGSRAGNILKGDGSKGGIVMKNNGGTWSPN